MKKINKEEKSIIIEKYNNLENAKNQLKKEFVGLDDIIDEMIELVEPWYLFPDGQFRPSVINLFGMTGTGKTSLITRLFEILDMKSVLRFDTGEWVEKTDYQLSSTISGQIKKLKSHDSRPVFILDEFQLGRTLDATGADIDRPNLRVIWDLLDSGKFSIIEENWQTSSLQILYNKLSYLIEETGVRAKNGKITKGYKDWCLYFDYRDEHLDDDELKDLKKDYTTHALIPQNEIYAIYDTNDKFLSEKEIYKYILSLKNEKEILKFIEETLVNSSKAVEYDFSDAIIFIIGNLDGAYRMAYDLDADTDPDTLREFSEKININNIKTALSELYRPEQISRLGNNYLIYRSFSSQNYRDLIDLELNKIKTKIYDKFDLEIDFSDKTKQLIFKEGVFASQGVRPIFSTITSLIETKVGRIIVDLLKNKNNTNNIKWDVDKKRDNFILTTDDNQKYKYNLKLKVDNLRDSVGDDIQALVGVHEAGHVLASVYEMNILPEIAVSKTTREGGFTQIDFPEWNTKNLLEQRLVMLYGGFVAERMIFGEENLTSGSFSDIENANKIAIAMVKDFGMITKLPIQHSTPDFRIVGSYINDNGLDDDVKNVIINALNKTEKILSENKTLLIEMGKFLTKNSKIEKKKIKAMVKKYGSWSVPTYKTKDNYYNFKEILYNENI